MEYRIPEFVLALHQDAMKRGVPITTFSGPAHQSLYPCEERNFSFGKKYNFKTLVAENDIPLQAARDFVDKKRLLYLPVTIDHPIVNLPNGRRESYFSQSEEHMKLQTSGQLKSSHITLPAFFKNLKVVGYVSNARIDEFDNSLQVQLDIDESLINPSDFRPDYIHNKKFPISLTHFIYGPETRLISLNEIVPTEIALVTKNYEPRRPGSIVSKVE